MVRRGDLAIGAPPLQPSARIPSERCAGWRRLTASSKRRGYWRPRSPCRRRTPGGPSSGNAALSRPKSEKRGRLSVGKCCKDPIALAIASPGLLTILPFAGIILA